MEKLNEQQSNLKDEFQMLKERTERLRSYALITEILELVQLSNLTIPQLEYLFFEAYGINQTIREGPINQVSFFRNYRFGEFTDSEYTNILIAEIQRACYQRSDRYTLKQRM